ncbi:MAG: isovaleryl-CoA dehydrogenase [Alphaproteobacteria bacterium]|nr:isovaleryl-CoA dehydrogenase [Alphaproteobacteria bacterium]
MTIGSWPLSTHEVLNQPPPLVDWNLFDADRALAEGVAREGADWAAGELRGLGARLGSEETIAWSFQANRFAPVLQAFDRFGHRRDEVEFHPAWHALLGLAVEAGLHSAPWAKPGPGAHVARAAGAYMFNQIEAGTMCPVAMTYGVVPALRHQPDVLAEWREPLFGRRYDPRNRPAPEKRGALFGMAMTEKQGGSDVRANTTRAVPDGRAWRLVGHKWFCSAPMCDAFLTLAYVDDALTCFLAPRWTPDGAKNAIHIQRLKDKLGNRANASSEIEYHGAYAVMVGERGRGVPTIIEMANHTRLDCVIGSAGLVRQSLTQAIHHARHRTVFQRRLADQPLMRAVLADLALEAEAATLLMLRLARAYDGEGPDETAFRRLVTPAAKYWVCKRAPVAVVEAMEVHGGGGYVEESILPRLYREAPVNSIWEGSGNVMCLDVLRVLARTPDAIDALIDELALAQGADRRLDAQVAALADEAAAFAKAGMPEHRARLLVERMVLTLQAALMVRHAPAALADGFCASRLGGADSGRAFGALPDGLDLAAIVTRAGHA